MQLQILSSAIDLICHRHSAASSEEALRVSIEQRFPVAGGVGRGSGDDGFEEHPYDRGLGGIVDQDIRGDFCFEEALSSGFGF